MEFNILTFLAIELARNSRARAQSKARPLADRGLPDVDYTLLDWPPEEGNPESELRNAERHQQWLPPSLGIDAVSKKLY
jgi:hypothetical protein